MSWAARFELRQYLKGSLWVLPLLGGLLGAVLAQVALLVDGAVRLSPDWSYSGSTASGVLTAIVGAMVALIGFVVTVGVLVVQQATGTLSPRYMRLWYRDRLQKAVLATFVGTFTFAFSLLRRVEDDFVPDVGVTTAGIAVAASIGLLLIYLDRFTHNLRPVAVAALVGRSGQEVLTSWIPQLRGHDARPAAIPDVVRPDQVVRADRAGSVQAVNLRTMVALAQRYGSTLVLARSVGDFVTPGTPLVEVHGAAIPAGGKQLRGLFALGRERTIEQDPAFALRIMVDIATMALSPAVNAPTTAVQVLDHLEDFMRWIGAEELPAQVEHRDQEGRLRLLVPSQDWDELLTLAVTEIRLYGGSAIQVVRRLRAMLEGLHEAVRPEYRATVEAELARLDATVARRFAESPDLDRASRADRQGLGGPVAAGEREA